MAGFMSGFGPAFGKAFSTGVENAQKAYDDEVKTKMAFALEQKTAFEKAKAADAAMVKKAEALATNVPGAPDEAWKVVYTQLKAGRNEEKILEELRKGSWSAVKTPEKATEVEKPVAKTASETAVEASVDAQMEGAMGEPTKAPETAASVSEEPVEEKGFFGKIVEDISKPRSERLKEDTVKRIGVDEATYESWVGGYTSDVDATLKGYSFAPDLTEDADKLPTTPKGVETYLFTQSKQYKEMLANGDQEGISAKLLEIENRYDGEGSVKAPFYGIKLEGGLTESKTDALEANITLGLLSDNPEIKSQAEEYRDTVLPVWRKLTEDNGSKAGTLTEKDLLSMNPQQLQGTITYLGSIENPTPEQQDALQIAKKSLQGQRQGAVEQSNLEATGLIDVKVPDGQGGFRLVRARKQQNPDTRVIEYVDPNTNQPIVGQELGEKELSQVSDILQLQNTYARDYKVRVPQLRSTLAIGKSAIDDLTSSYGVLATTSVGKLATVATRIGNEIDAASTLIKLKDGGTEEGIYVDDALEQLGYSSMSALEEAANVRGNVEAKIMLLGFRSGAMEGQSGAALSNKDFDRLMKIFKSDSGSPITVANKIKTYLTDYVTSLEDQRTLFETDGTVRQFEQFYGYVPEAGKLVDIRTVLGESGAPLLEFFSKNAPDLKGAEEESEGGDILTTLMERRQKLGGGN